MRIYLSILYLFILSLSFCSCKKNTASSNIACDPDAATTRTIINKKATVKITATAAYSVYLVEEGAIDSKLVPCNFPIPGEYYQNDLQVIISGEVKATDPSAYGPCCFENFVITSITK